MKYLEHGKKNLRMQISFLVSINEICYCRFLYIEFNGMNYDVLLKMMYRLVMFYFLFFLSSCSGGEDSMGDEQPVQDEMIISAESSTFFSDGMSFKSDAGSHSIYFTTNRDWNVVVTSADWCVATPAFGEAGENTFSVSVSENTDETLRTATVTLKAGSISRSLVVTQEGKAQSSGVTGGSEDYDEEQGTWDE